MYSKVAYFYFCRRAAEFRRLLAYGFIGFACLAAILPSKSLLILGGVIFAASAILIYGRSVRDRDGIDASKEFEPKNQREFANLPFPNPFDPDIEMPVPDRITAAALASKEFGRTICLLRLDFPPANRFRRQRAAGERMEAIEAVAAVIRSNVRKTDLVAVIDDGFILVGLNLAPNFSAADRVATRLTERIVSSSKWPWPDAPQFGRAIYPLDGYTGEELIDAARLM